MALSDENMLLLYWNHFDLGSLTASSAATAVTRLQDIRPGRVWRATGYTAEWVKCDLGSAKNLTHAAVIAHNLDTSGTIRVRAGNDASFATTLYDSGVVDAWPPIAGFGSDGFGTSLGGYPILSDFADYRPFRFFDFGGTISARYIRYDFTSTSSAGNIQVGRLFAGVGYQPTYNLSYGWGYDWVDPSEITDTEASAFILGRTKYRQFTLPLENIPQDEALFSMDDFKRIVGNSKSVLLVLFPKGSLPLQYRTSVYGIVKENKGLTNPFFQCYDTSIVVRELTQ